MTDTLKPCPFCGGRDLRFSEYMTDGGPRENVQCEDCAAELGGWKRPGSAITAWNTRAEAAEANLAEMTRRRDAWQAKAEGYDAVRLALREKVGAPWPPKMSRLLWAGIAADEKKRADDAEAERDEARAALVTARQEALEEAAKVAAGQYRNYPTVGYRRAPDQSDMGRGVQRGKEQAAAAIRAIAALEADT